MLPVHTWPDALGFIVQIGCAMVQRERKHMGFGSIPIGSSSTNATYKLCACLQAPSQALCLSKAHWDGSKKRIGVKVSDTGFVRYISQSMLGHAEVTNPQLFFVTKTHFSICMKSSPGQTILLILWL